MPIIQPELYPQLDLEYHVTAYQVFAYENAETRAYFFEEALWSHSTCVEQALLKSQRTSLSFSQKMKSEQASIFAVFGISKRIHIVWSAFRNIRSIAFNHRKEPLHREEISDANRDINSIYMHITGILDNIAWCISEEYKEKYDNINRNNISLFKEKFWKCFDDKAISSAVLCFDQWNRDLRKKRDPAAHRIPLTVAPSSLQPHEAESYQLLNTEAQEALAALDFETASRKYDEMESLGNFIPLFYHLPSEGGYNIFPTLSNDIAQTLKIFHIIDEKLISGAV